MADSATVTQLLNAAQTGDSSAIDTLFPLIYDELRQRAHAQRAGFGGHATMNTTAIVHEAYFKLAGARDGATSHDPTSQDANSHKEGKQKGGSWQSRAHFYAVAAKAMRHVFLDYAKRKTRQKRGDGAVHVSLDTEFAPQVASVLGEAEADQVMALEAALIELQRLDERAARVVECRFFGGMTVEDTGAALNLSPATVKRDWVYARTMLFQLMQDSNG